MNGGFNLGGRVAVVTGAASGIGRAVAYAFAEAGCYVVAIDRNGVRLQRGTEQFTLKLLPIRVKQAPKAARR